MVQAAKTTLNCCVAWKESWCLEQMDYSLLVSGLGRQPECGRHLWCTCYDNQKDRRYLDKSEILIYGFYGFYDNFRRFPCKRKGRYRLQLS
jgi:hypothetical protein